MVFLLQSSTLISPNPLIRYCYTPQQIYNLLQYTYSSNSPQLLSRQISLVDLVEWCPQNPGGIASTMWSHQVTKGLTLLSEFIWCFTRSSNLHLIINLQKSDGSIFRHTTSVNHTLNILHLVLLIYFNVSTIWFQVDFFNLQIFFIATGA